MQANCHRAINDVRLFGVYLLYSLLLGYWPPCKRMSSTFMHGESHLGEYTHWSLPKCCHRLSKHIPIMPFVMCSSGI